MKNHNKSLFWYGFWAKVKKAFGMFLVFVGMGAIFLFMDYWFIGIGIIIMGIIIRFKGHSQRFDYKMQSGYMVHGGDR